MWMSLGGQFLRSRAVSVSLHPGVQQHLGVSRGIPFFTGGAGWNLEDSKLRQQQCGGCGVNLRTRICDLHISM